MLGLSGEPQVQRLCPKKWKSEIFHNVQQDEIVEDMGSIMPRIYIVMDNKQVEYQLHKDEVEGMINNHAFNTLIDSRASHSYIDFKVV